MKRLPRVIIANSPCAEAGVIIRGDGIGATVPELPGDSVTGYADFDDGGSATITIRRQWDGDVVATSSRLQAGEIVAPSPAGRGAGTGQCQDSFYVSNSWKESGGTTWYYNNASGGPSGLSTVSDITAAWANWDNVDDACGYPDRVILTATYGGTRSGNPDILTTGSCGTSDGVSEVGWRDTAALGLTCTFASGGEINFADTSLDSSRSWYTGATPAGCSGAYSVENVATHEFGHSWGLGDTGSGHPELTMGGNGSNCTKYQTTLGCGDVIGLFRKYSATPPSC